MHLSTNRPTMMTMFTLSTCSRRSNAHSGEFVAYADEFMWSTLANQDSEIAVHDDGKHDVPTWRPRPPHVDAVPSCSRSCVEIHFSRRCSQQLDVHRHVRPNTNVMHPRILDERMKADDPFCLVVDCGDENLFTTWIVELVSTRVQRGRVLRWARHHDASLSGLREVGDGMITGVSSDDDDDDTQRSPSNSRWRPGLTGVSVGVITPTKKNLLQLRWLALLASFARTHCS